MNRYLFDTNTVSPFIDGNAPLIAKVAAALRRGDRIGTCPPVLGEIYYGAENSPNPAPKLLKLRQRLPKFIVWPYDKKSAEVYGRIAAHLRKVGRPMQVVDMQLAAVALTVGCVVVTADSDLSAVPGLAVENWLAT